MAYLDAFVTYNPLFRIPVDYETDPFLSFDVLARDRGTPPLIGRSHVTLHVRDLNDNAPVFMQSFYRSCT